MLRDPFRNALVLTGPTGSGKSALALEIAQTLGAEIIAMDSMTLYRGMDIGTAKPPPQDRSRVPQHMIDVLDPWQPASVAWWLSAAARVCRDIEDRGKRVLFVGGTALYLKALLHGLFEGPAADPALRLRLQSEAENVGSRALHKRLAAVDPVSAARLHPNDLRRVIRALEVWESTGQPLSRWQEQSRWTKEADEEAGSVVWLDLPRPELYARIDARVVRMFETGLIDEVRRLRSLPQPLGREASRALAYREVQEHLDGQRTLTQTIELIQQRTRNYAKRQLTWFRNLPQCRAIALPEAKGATSSTSEVRRLTFAAWGLTISE